MRFNQHSELRDRHAFLSPSGYHWLNYDEEKLTSRFFTVMAAKRGTDLHNLAHEAIRLRILLDVSNDALCNYVKDAIELNMVCEQSLYYSENCFGSADTIVFNDDTLRIHDYKSGVTQTSFKQLEVYAALFCLEYSVNPEAINIELRIYQREEVRVSIPEPEAILVIMDKIVHFDQHIETIKGG